MVPLLVRKKVIIWLFQKNILILFQVLVTEQEMDYADGIAGDSA